MENLTNVAIYNLTKQKIIYNEVSSELVATMKNSNSAVFKSLVVYSYKPIVYIGAACLYQLMKRKVTAVDIFVHASMWLVINHYDFHNSLKTTYPAKMKECEEATENYQRAMRMQKFSLWNYLKKRAQSTIYP